jgi:hypothetical protein
MLIRPLPTQFARSSSSTRRSQELGQTIIIIQIIVVGPVSRLWVGSILFDDDLLPTTYEGVNVYNNVTVTPR